MSGHRDRRLIAAVLAVLAASAAHAATEYDAIDITDAALAGTNACAWAKYPRNNGLNAWGDVVGLATPGTNEYDVVGASRPFIFFKSRRTKSNLGNIEGDDGFGVDESVSGYAINDLGWVAGGSGTFSYSRPFLWIDDDLNGVRDEGEMHELDLNEDNYRSSAEAVNNAGQVLIGGNATLCRAQFAYANGILEEVGDRTVLIEDFANSFAINEHGDACWEVSRTGYRKGFRWIDRNTNGVAEASEIAEINSPFGGDRASATDINDAGWVIGSAARPDGKRRGFLWIDANDNDVAEVSEFEELTQDYLQSYIYPKGINNHGVVVGDVALGSDRFAFVWDARNGLRKLDDLFTLTHPVRGAFTARLAYQVNDFGQIALEGDYEATGNDDYAALLTPLPRFEGLGRVPGSLEFVVGRQSLATTVTVERCDVAGGAVWTAVGGWVAEGTATNWLTALPAEVQGVYRARAAEFPGARAP